MGYNTTVLIINDALDSIRTDPNFGKNLADAVCKVGALGGKIDVSAGNHYNAATVIESHHADRNVLVEIGGNTGEIVGERCGNITFKAN
jgi:hypothetical protein